MRHNECKRFIELGSAPNLRNRPAGMLLRVPAGFFIRLQEQNTATLATV
jgi:hypothetical protein